MAVRMNVAIDADNLLTPGIRSRLLGTLRVSYESIYDWILVAREVCKLSEW